MFVASMCTVDKNSLLNAVGAAQGRKGRTQATRGAVALRDCATKV